MSPDIVRWVVALAVLGHGIGHVLFMPLLSGAMKLDSSGRSWLLTGVLGDGATQLLATTVAAAVTVGFIAVAGGIATQTTWWRSLAIIVSIASIVLVAVMWGGLLAAPATWAIAFDAAILIALLVLDWPSRDLIGI